MIVVESILEQYETWALVRLSCGHEYPMAGNPIRLGMQIRCFDCPPADDNVKPATPEQISAIVEDYAATMRAKGIVIHEAELGVLMRAAYIHDAWRVAFAKVMK